MVKNKTIDTKKKEEKTELKKEDRRKKENRRHIILPMGKENIDEEPYPPFPEEDESEEPGAEEQPENSNKKGSKTCTIYQCPMCNRIEPDEITREDNPITEGVVAFKTPEETTKHIKDLHGMSVIPEDVEVNCKIEVIRSTGEKILRGVEDILDAVKEEEGIQQKRFEMALVTPRETEPKTVVSEFRARDPTQVYRETVAKMVAPPGTQDENDIYNESISGGMIQVQLMKSFPLQPEIISALSVLKKYM